MCDQAVLLFSGQAEPLVPLQADRGLRRRGLGWVSPQVMGRWDLGWWGKPSLGTAALAQVVGRCESRQAKR